MPDNLTTPISSSTVIETVQQPSGAHRPVHRVPESDAILSGINGKLPAQVAGKMPVDLGSATVTTSQYAFRPLPQSTVSVAAGPTATGAGKLPLSAAGIPAGTATAYRVRNANNSQSPITWILTTDPTKVPVIPTPYAADGTGGTVGDKTIDPGSVEIVGLTAAQQTALAAGTLYLSAITPGGGAGVLSITPGNGA